MAALVEILTTYGRCPRTMLYDGYKQPAWRMQMTHSMS